MFISCLRALARFADPPMILKGATPAPMLWDEHGGTFVLRLDKLEVAEDSAPELASGLSLSLSLSPSGPLIRDLEGFAATHQLPLSPPSGPELLEEAVLAACHLPGQNLFIFAEEPHLAVKKQGETVALEVTGSFKARRVPCQETDLVIHLTRAAMSRLVALVLSLARAGD
jgi:hypothetical protein